MDKFEDWLDKKGYHWNWTYNFQMGIGFMFEYLFEHGKTIVTIPYEKQKTKDIMELHTYLIREIKKI